MITTPIRLSVSESAKIIGIDQITIRRAIQKQELSCIVVQGRYKINFENLLNWALSKPTLSKKLLNKGIGQFVEKWRSQNSK
jgi:hypothetical protein